MGALRRSSVVGAAGLTLLTLVGDPFGVDRSPSRGPSFVASVEADERPGPAVGQVAPDVQLGDQHGKAFVLGETLKARDFVVLAFYPKAFTGG